MSPLQSALRRLRLRDLIFLLLLLSGIIPLAVSSFLLIRQNREILETQEKSYLTRSAQFLSVELNNFLRTTRGEVAQLGEAVLAAPPEAETAVKLGEPWLLEFAQEFLAERSKLLALRLLDRQGVGRFLAAADLPATIRTAMDAGFERAVAEPGVHYDFEVLPTTGEPVAVLAAALPAGSAEPRLVAQSVVLLGPMKTFFEQEAQGEVAVFLIDRDGAILWSVGSDREMDEALGGSPLVEDFVAKPVNMTREYGIQIGGDSVRMLGRVSPVYETGWGVVVHRPVAAAFAAVDEMIFKTAILTAGLVALAFLIAVLAAPRLGRPIAELAASTHEIAAGKFGKRVEVSGPGREINDLAADFNRMSGHLQRYVEQLRRAAQENQELFIGSMRAFAAAIDAKDPYTRGHSERVAAYSRIIAQHLGLTTEMQHRIWVGALMHDVGKIGIDDRVLRKGGVLTDDEYELMKQHPVIGAQIMSRIDQLKEMIPAIRWHHEAWNGKGYPDGLKSEEIPLMARIVGVADTFDAITTNRPYQRAYDPEFAVKTITKIVGSRFDAKVVTAFLRAFEAGQIKTRTRTAPAPTEAASAAASAGG